VKVYVVSEYDRSCHHEYVIAVYQSEREANDFTTAKWQASKYGNKTWCVEEFDLIESTQTPGK